MHKHTRWTRSILKKILSFILWTESTWKADGVSVSVNKRFFTGVVLVMCHVDHLLGYSGLLMVVCLWHLRGILGCQHWCVCRTIDIIGHTQILRWIFQLKILYHHQRNGCVFQLNGCVCKSVIWHHAATAELLWCLNMVYLTRLLDLIKWHINELHLLMRVTILCNSTG